MNARLAELMAREAFAHPVKTERDREVRVVLGCAGVGAKPGEEHALLDELQTFIACRQQQATLDEAIAVAFPDGEPAFIKQGDVISVDTTTGAYRERVRD